MNINRKLIKLQKQLDNFAEELEDEIKDLLDSMYLIKNTESVKFKQLDRKVAQLQSLIDEVSSIDFKAHLI